MILQPNNYLNIPLASSSAWQVVDNNLDDDNCDSDYDDDNDDSGGDAYCKPTSFMHDMNNVDKV